MANSILTPTAITREALRVLHQKLNFVGNVNRQYDNKFAQSGAKIGTSLNIRMPSKYSVRTGATLTAQDHVERSTPLTVSSQYGVDVSFTTVELTMQLDDFSKRIIEPAMAQLAAKIESDALAAAYKLVPNYVNATTNAKMTYAYFQGAGAKLARELSPLSSRVALLNPASKVEFLDATKGLFQAQDNLARQYREGLMGRTGGFDIYENTLLPSHTTGSLAGSAVVTGEPATTTTANSWVSQTTLSVTGATSTTTLKAGDIITISYHYAAHPESKANTGRLRTFVVQSDVTLTTAANAYAVTVKPGIMTGSGNGYQNVVLSGATVASGAAVTLIGAASTAFAQDLFFHEDAFVFATADLEDVSRYGAWGAREAMDGISMRIARQYAISSDTVPCRIDVLAGFAGLYPELAVRHMTTDSLLTV
jgi:hypothetical protein